MSRLLRKRTDLANWPMSIDTHRSNHCFGTQEPVKFHTPNEDSFLFHHAKSPFVWSSPIVIGLVMVRRCLPCANDWPTCMCGKGTMLLDAHPVIYQQLSTWQARYAPYSHVIIIKDADLSVRCFVRFDWGSRPFNLPSFITHKTDSRDTFRQWRRRHHVLYELLMATIQSWQQPYKRMKNGSLLGWLLCAVVHMASD